MTDVKQAVAAALGARMCTTCGEPLPGQKTERAIKFADLCVKCMKVTITRELRKQVPHVPIASEALVDIERRIEEIVHGPGVKVAVAAALGALACAKCGKLLPGEKRPGILEVCAECMKVTVTRERALSVKTAVAAALGAPSCKTCGGLLVRKEKTWTQWVEFGGMKHMKQVVLVCPKCSKYAPSDHDVSCFCSGCLR